MVVDGDSHIHGQITAKPHAPGLVGVRQDDTSSLSATDLVSYKKEIARMLLDTLDDESVRELGRILAQRGLINPIGTLPSSPLGPKTPVSLAPLLSAPLVAAPPPPAAVVAHTRPVDTSLPHSNKVMPSTITSTPISRADAPAILSTHAVQSPTSTPSATPAVEKTRSLVDVAVSGLASNNNKLAPVDASERAVAVEVADKEVNTTVIIRNLPSHLDQASAQRWVDELGYRGKYNFFLWFPAKLTSRNSAGYAFINFRLAWKAQEFLKEHHLTHFPREKDGDNAPRDTPLNLAFAKAQGFALNYARFKHLLDGNEPTRCKPFFANDTVAALTSEELDAAVQMATNVSVVHKYQAPDTIGTESSDDPLHTVVIRNLPAAVETQVEARCWLDSAGFAFKYNLLLFLPAKTRKMRTVNEGLGYMFVNFKDDHDARDCISKLNGHRLKENDPTLSVVVSRKQGFQECLQHFSSLVDAGRCQPWTEDAERATPTVPAADRPKGLQQFQ